MASIAVHDAKYNQTQFLTFELRSHLETYPRIASQPLVSLREIEEWLVGPLLGGHQGASSKPAACREGRSPHAAASNKSTLCQSHKPRLTLQQHLGLP